METLTIALLVFAAGMVVEGWRLLGLLRVDKADFLKLLGSLGIAIYISVVCPLDGDYLTGSYVNDVFLIFYFSFSGFYLVAFKKKVFGAIDERTLLIWSLLFLYVIGQYFINLNLSLATIFGLSVITIIVPLIAAKKMPKAAKTLFYLWYIFIAVVFGLLQFDINAVFSGSGNIDMVLIFLKGMASLYLLMCVLQIGRMIPVTMRNQTEAERMAEWREDVDFLAEKFSDRQIPPRQMMLTAALTVALIGANAYFKIVSIQNLISIVMVLTSIATVGRDKIMNIRPITAADPKISLP